MNWNPLSHLTTTPRKSAAAAAGLGTLGGLGMLMADEGEDTPISSGLLGGAAAAALYPVAKSRGMEFMGNRFKNKDAEAIKALQDAIQQAKTPDAMLMKQYAKKGPKEVLDELKAAEVLPTDRNDIVEFLKKHRSDSVQTAGLQSQKAADRMKAALANISDPDLEKLLKSRAIRKQKMLERRYQPDVDEFNAITSDTARFEAQKEARRNWAQKSRQLANRPKEMDVRNANLTKAVLGTAGGLGALGLDYLDPLGG